MDLARVDLNLLVAFEALLAERSVTKAARRLGLSQPAASDALRRLRLLFRDELFVRGAGAMQPSPKALQIAPGVQAALAGLRATLGVEVPFAPDEAVQGFALAMTDYNAHVVLPPLAACLRETAPGVELHVVGYEKGEIGAMLARGEVDVAFGVFPDPPPDAAKTALFAERFVGVARRGHPALMEGAPDLAAFAALPHALVTVRRDDRSGAIDQALARHGLKRRVVLTLPHMLVLPAVLVGSDLVCALPTRIAGRLDPAVVQAFELPLDLAPWMVEMLWNPVARTDQANAWLRQAIQAVARELR